MDIKEYLIGVVAAAVLCGITLALIGKKGLISTFTRLLCGLFITLVAMKPWLTVSFHNWRQWNDDVTIQAEEYVSYGEEMAQSAYRASIKEQLEAYILDETKALDCSVTVDVTLSDERIPKPMCVTISGNISPYAKRIIETMLTEKLGISREDQVWTGPY